MFRTIQRRIVIPYVILILAILTGLGAYTTYKMQQTYRSALQSKLAAEASWIADALEASLQKGDSTETVNDLTQHWASLFQNRVTILDPGGKVMGESDPNLASLDNPLDRPEVAAALEAGAGSSIRVSQTTGTETLYYAIRVDLDGKTAAIVRVAVPLTQVQASLTNLRWTILWTSLIASAVAILLAIWIAGSTTRPLRQLTQIASDLARRDFRDPHISDRMPANAPVEVGRLAEAFNRLAVQLRSQMNAVEVEKSKTSAVLQAMNDGVLMVDSRGFVRMINPAAERMFAVVKENVLERSLAEGLRHHQLVELWQRSRESDETQTALLEISTERLFLQGIAKPMTEALPGSTLLLFNNLTRQRYLETVRRDFISNISHELRTPLASLKALTETLQAGALEDPPAAHRFLQRMETEVDALTQMVAELFELTRIESGRVPLQLKPTRAIDVITSAVDRLRLQAERGRLSLHIHCPDSLPAVLADLPRLEQVMVNLLHNAIKFTPPGGEIHVDARLEEGANGSPSRIVFSVRDTGVGITAEDLPRIFERFYKADRARSSGGTGLGLAIARHTVEAHQGRIWAESVEGQGSTFYFSIPVSQG